MISVIVYGRNDDRGYGMVKRVAISINALSLQIARDAGEILFVDYNTPDHLPTLPELIWDTFTQEARERLRILRVRPAHHAQFASMTPLPVIESVARNVALRRSNPANRWILSTNTDAMIAPRQDSRLCDFVDGLQDGIYGLPRFELPERSWEGFNRGDPEECLSLASAWADEACLRQTVFGVDDVLFDNPGDFQLVPRSTLMTVGGFEEEMLLGWHVDHNLAKRVSFHLGPIRSLADHFELYHLGHARNVVATHSSGRMQNDTFRFVAALKEPEALHGNAPWGLARDVIEEIRLDFVPGEQVRAVCRAIMPPLNGARPTSRYAADSFDDFRYDARTAVAHLLDLLSCYSPAATVAYAGSRRDVLGMLRKGLAALGFRKKLLVPAGLAGHLACEGQADVQLGEDGAVLNTADVLIFEFGVDDDSPLAATNQGIHQQIAGMLVDAAQLDRYRSPNEPARLFIAVNSVHTRFETLVDETIAAGTSPYATRLRYGLVRRPDDRQAAPFARVHPEDRAHAKGLIARLRRQGGLSADERLDIAAHAGLIRNLLELPGETQLAPEETAAIGHKLAEITKPEPSIAAIGSSVVSAPFVLSGPAGSRAWDDPEWASTARYFTRSRSGWAWERAQLMIGLARGLRTSPRARVLVVSEHPDRIVDALAARFGSLDVMDVRACFGDSVVLRDAHAFVPEFSGGSKLRVVTLDALRPSSYEAIILPHAAAFRGGMGRFDEVVAPLCTALSVGGLLAIGGEVSVLGQKGEMRPSLEAAGEGGFASQLKDVLGMRLSGYGGSAPSADDLALVGTREQRDRGLPVLGIGEDGDVLWPFVWFFEKTISAQDALAGVSLKSAMNAMKLGEQIGKLSLGAGAERQDGAIVNRTHESREGHAVFGPFLRLEPGDYRVHFDFSTIGARAKAPKDTRVVTEVSLGDAIVAQRTIAISNRKLAETSVTLDLRVSRRDDVLEMRVWTNGFVDFELNSARIEKRPDLKSLAATSAS